MSRNPDNRVVTRFAPSPTGHLHIGGARTALFCWAYARRHGGGFILRVEDTDQARSSDSAATGILEDLAWLGVHWDEGPEYTSEDETQRIGGDPRSVGPFHQAERLEIYNRYIEQLMEKGLAYAAFETPEELEAKRKAAIAAKKTYRYDRAALQIPEKERNKRVRAGEPHVVRFKAPDDPITLKDEILGEIAAPAEELDDLVIRKADGYPTYHFACVVDDELMGVTHVLRGQEHLSNTPRHVAMQRALGFRTPAYAHLPLIFNMDGSKMSKRDKDKALRQFCRDSGVETSPCPDVVAEDEFQRWLADKHRQLDADGLIAIASEIGASMPEIDVDDFRRAGYLPEVLCNFIALLGWNPGLKNDDGTDLERFDTQFLREHFGFDRIGKANARFDRNKLLAFNADAIADMTDEQFRSRWRTWCAQHASNLILKLTTDRFNLLADAVHPRSKTFRDAADRSRFVLTDDDEIEFDPKAVQKVLHKDDGAGLSVLSDIRPVIEQIDPFDTETVEARVQQFAEDRGVGMGNVAQPLRVALTGSTVSPGLGHTLALLGRDSVLARIDRCLQHCAQETSEPAKQPEK